jgi:glucose dehydrogenase
VELVGGSLYVAASAGQLIALDAATGSEAGRFDIAAHTSEKIQLLATPAVHEEEGVRQIYLAVGVESVVSRAAVLYALRESR